jgi:diketogulonate reductase-like aldo/keto reductase
VAAVNEPGKFHHPISIPKGAVVVLREERYYQLEDYSQLTRGNRLNHPTILAVAKKYGKTPAQVLIH